MKRISLNLGRYEDIRKFESILLYDILGYKQVQPDPDNPKGLRTIYGSTIIPIDDGIISKSYTMFVDDSLEVFDVRVSTSSFITKNQDLGCALQISLFDDVNALILECHIFLANRSPFIFLANDGAETFEIEVIPSQET